MRLAVQLFTLRDLMEKDLPGTLAKVFDAGFMAVETAGTYGLSASGFRDELTKAGLKAVACHVGLSDIEDNLAETVQDAKSLGAEWLVVPWVPKEAYAKGWADFGSRLGRAAERVIAKGMKLAYHNHAFEFEPEDGVPGFEVLWNNTPETVEAEVDLYWAHYAGHDPSEWLRKLAGRVPLAHFKDGVGDKHMPAGEGDMDWASIIPAAKTAGVEWAIVELDECPRDPIECVATSFNYLRGLGVDQ